MSETRRQLALPTACSWPPCHFVSDPGSRGVKNMDVVLPHLCWLGSRDRSWAISARPCAARTNLFDLNPTLVAVPRR